MKNSSAFIKNNSIIDNDGIGLFIRDNPNGKINNN